MKRSPLFPYLIAIALIAMTVTLKRSVDLYLEYDFNPYNYFLIPVVVAAWLGGARPGLFALVLGAVIATAVFLPSPWVIALSRLDPIGRVVAFLIEGGLICLFAGLMHGARREAEQQQRIAEDAYREARDSLDELTRMQGALDSSRQQFHRLMDANLIGMFLIDRDGLITSANEAFLGIVDLPAHDVSMGNVHLDALAAGESDQARRRVYAELAEHGRCAPREREFGQPGGPRKPVLFGAARYDEIEGTAICVAVDLTELKRTEAALREAIGEAESATRVKSDFLANISHELRTPMNAIIGMTELALQADLPDEAAENLQIARESADALLRLLNDLLDFSRIESGKFSLIAEPFSLESAVFSTVRSLALRAHAKGLEINVRISPSVPGRFFADSMRLSQVIANLIGNAVKFTEQGEIGLDVELLERRENRARLQFCVSDTGIGIAATDQQRVFAPFTQVDPSSTRRHHGSGLGLAISAQLVAMMNGRFWLESEPSSGSKFFFTAELPLVDEPDEEISVQRLLEPLRSSRIVVADDNATARAALMETLEHWGLRATACSDGAEAIEALRAAASDDGYTIAVLDGLMPGVDGFDAAAAIEADPLLCPGLILTLSAFDRRQFAERCDELPRAVLLEKPVARAELAEALLAAAFPERVERPARAATLADDPPAFKARILVTEDTPANQKVIERVLRKRGHDVVVAHNGRQALELCREQRFDVVLMDVQMPTMDGFQATAAIRALGPPSSDAVTPNNVPVIAMTAHVMRGDRERCLEAGMDAYLGKPIDARQTIVLVERFAKQHRESLGQAETAASDGNGQRAQIDLGAALRRLEGDRELLDDVIRLFVEDSPVLLETIDANLESRNAERIERAAHSLKGLASNLDARATIEAAWNVEKAARDGRMDEAVRGVAPLRREVERLCSTLEAVRREG
jgi:PAS domain S-box-containing protein